MSNILVVGAGAVGQVYGHHLARGGARVGLWVRPARRDQAVAGFTLTQIPALGRRRTARFIPSFVATSEADLPVDIDAVWLCVPTDALDDALVERLASACPRAAFVILSPGHFVRARMDPIVGARRAIYGIIGMISYAAPLDGSEDPREAATPRGVAYFLSRTVLSGARALAARDELRRGGVSADVVVDATAELAQGSAVLMPNVACLDLVGYSFARYRAEIAQLAADATAESLAVASSLTGLPPPPFAGLLDGPLGATALRVGSWVAPRVTPLDVEAFLRVHFTKVRTQTELLLRSSVEAAEARGLPRAAMAEVLSRFRASESGDADEGAAPPRG